MRLFRFISNPVTVIVTNALAAIVWGLSQTWVMVIVHSCFASFTLGCEVERLVNGRN